jgi:hypothetical protein
MFNQTVDDRLSAWAEHRKMLDSSVDPLTDTWEFWRVAPYIPYNNKIDPFNQKSWPTPWSIIVDNKYDDFTKALMIAWSLRFTKRYKESKIEIKTLVNNQKKCYYNVVCVDDCWAINYNDNGPVSMEDIPDSFYLENLIDVSNPW